MAVKRRSGQGSIKKKVTAPRAATGRGRVRRTVSVDLGDRSYDVELGHDASDALAIAICHAHASPFIESIERKGRA